MTLQIFLTFLLNYIDQISPVWSEPIFSVPVFLFVLIGVVSLIRYIISGGVRDV